MSNVNIKLSYQAWNMAYVLYNSYVTYYLNLNIVGDYSLEKYSLFQDLPPVQDNNIYLLV